MKMRFAQDHAAEDRRLVDYLLGLLPEEDAERLDEASVVDDEVAARLRAVEDDLIDAYVRGTLATDRLFRFEKYYLASPRRREKVAFARRFAGVVDRAAVTAPLTAVQPSRPRRAIWKLAAVAAVLLLVCAALMMQTLRLGRGITVAEQERQALDRRAKDLQQQVTTLRAANEAAVREAAPPKPVPEAPTIALVLLPQTRAAGPVPTLVVPAGAARIAFELRLDNSDRATYQVGLRDPAVNRIVWRSAWMASSGSSLMLSVPASILKPQHYSLDLFSREAADPDVVGSYAFEIAAR